MPADRCPAIERAVEAAVLCEDLRPDVRWIRVPDPTWPRHGRVGLAEGRPCIDVALQATQGQRNAA